uniref:EamA domain-containing protein n=1 Tax=Meloidogyne hapla TaxID=6305 RepID=A0A1I8B8A1_MELHA
MPVENNYFSSSNWTVSNLLFNEIDSEDGYLGNIIGILVVLIGALCFGSMHVLIKRYSKGNDGIFIQWIMSFGSLIIGFIINILMGSPPFRLSVTGGGMLWPIANSLAQFVIFGLGLAPALLLWSTTNILTGWSTGRFGLFGLKQKIPEYEMLNIVGLITIIIGGICFAFIEKRLPQNSKKQVHIFPGRHCSLNMRRSFPLFGNDGSRKRINQQSSIYSNEHFEEGIERNHPIVNPQIILPSLCSGAIWGCGMMCLFLSNDLLTQTVTYPVLITIPGCVACIWSIFYFKEIPVNRKNLYIILLSFGLIFTGALLVFISKRRVKI